MKSAPIPLSITSVASTAGPDAAEQAEASLPAGGRRAALRRLALPLQAGLAVAVGGGVLGSLAGCASTPQISADVSSFGVWPQGRSAGSFAIERLPSQAKGQAGQDQLEAAATRALTAVGFSVAAKAEEADVLVQVGSRQGRVLDTGGAWYGFGFGYTTFWGGRRWAGPWHRGPRYSASFGFGPYWGPFGYEPTRDYREVALLLIDRASRVALVEVHVRQEARYVSDDSTAAMFDAALQGFPALPEGERTVVVPLSAKT